MASTFSDRLKQLRKHRNITQKQLGELLGITERGYQNYEIGKSTPNYETIVAIADFFNISVDYLMGRENDDFLIPQFIMKDEPYRRMSAAAKMAYGILLDNYGFNEFDLSKKLTESKQVSAKYLNKKVQQMLGLSDKKFMQLKEELEKFGLLSDD